MQSFEKFCGSRQMVIGNLRMVVFIFPLVLLGCGNSLNRNKDPETAHLQEEIHKLQDRLTLMENSPGERFHDAVDLASQNDWQAANEKFNSIIKDTPDDALVALSKQLLEMGKKDIAGRGEDIDFGQFYAKTKMGMTVGKRYRFEACLNQLPCLNSENKNLDQSICGVTTVFDDPSEQERWLSSGKEYCGTIVAGMLSGGAVGVFRIH